MAIRLLVGFIYSSERPLLIYELEMKPRDTVFPGATRSHCGYDRDLILHTRHSHIASLGEVETRKDRSAAPANVLCHRGLPRRYAAPFVECFDDHFDGNIVSRVRSRPFGRNVLARLWAFSQTPQSRFSHRSRDVIPGRRVQFKTGRWPLSYKRDADLVAQRFFIG